MAKNNDARVSFAINANAGTVTARMTGFTPLVLRVRDIPEAASMALMCDGAEKRWRNVIAGDKDSSDDTVYGRLQRKMETLQVGQLEMAGGGGINWAVFPRALEVVLAGAKVPVPEELGGGEWTTEKVSKRLVGKPMAEQLGLWNRPDVQAEVTRILAEEAQAALAKKGTVVLADF